MRATGTLTKDGLQISLTNREQLAPEDVIVATDTPRQMAVNIEGDVLICPPDAVLTPGNYSNNAILTEKQNLHAELFHPEGQQLTTLHILRRKPTSTDAAIWLGTNAGQLFNRSDQPVTVRTCDNFAWLDPGRGGQRSRDERGQCRDLHFKRRAIFTRKPGEPCS